MNMEDIESGSVNEYFPHGFLGKKENVGTSTLSGHKYYFWSSKRNISTKVEIRISKS